MNKIKFKILSFSMQKKKKRKKERYKILLQKSVGIKLLLEILMIGILFYNSILNFFYLFVC